jgi:asparagine synthetase B (glutamine-hydrolysing)
MARRSGRSAFEDSFVVYSPDPSQLQLEIDRIPTRNMGRDDRVISHHGKETRHPFLSLDVVAFLAGLSVDDKMDPRLEVGLGDKTLLRLAARKLGLVEASARKKRAMQFGSHSARMDAGTPNVGGELLIKLK